MMMVFLFQIRGDRLNPAHRSGQFIPGFPGENSWIILVGNPGIRIDMVQKGMDIVLEVMDHRRAAVKCLLIRKTTPTRKNGLATVIVVPVIDEWDNQFDMVSPSFEQRIIDMLQSYRIEGSEGRV